MTVSATVNRASYSGNGMTLEFTFPYYFLLNSDLRVLLKNNTTGASVVQILDTDYTLTGAGEQMGGTVTMAVEPAVGETLVIIGSPLITQGLDLIPNDTQPAEDVERAHDRGTIIARMLNDKIDRALHLDESYTDPFDMSLPDILEADSVILINDTNDGFVTQTITEFAARISEALGESGGVPDGGDQYALLEKTSSVDGEALWTGPIVYQGFSERYSELVNLKGLKAVTDYIMDMGYAPPTVSLSTSPVHSTIREKGDVIASVALTAAIGLVLDDIAGVRFYRGATLIDTQTSGGGIPSGGNSTYTDANAFSDNRTYSVQVDDDSAQAKPSATSSRTFTFVYPYYYGVGAAGLGAGVSALTKQIITEATSAVRSFTPNGSQKMYFAYPASYGTLSSILDINSFNTIADWTLTVANITGLDGNPVSYNIYEFNNFAVAGTYQYTFIQ